MNGPTGRTANICTDETFGDVELYLEFMLAKGSNSGIYLQGLYEIQIFDSWGAPEAMTTSDGGAIYHRWIEERGVGGSAPLVNASRRPGEWQSYQAWFRAPRFDAARKEDRIRAIPAGPVQRPARAEGRRHRRPDARRAIDSGSAEEPSDDPGRPRAGGAAQHPRPPAAPDRGAVRAAGRGVRRTRGSRARPRFTACRSIPRISMSR